MAWEVPVTIEGQQHTFRFEGDTQPTKDELHEAVTQYLAPSPEKSFAGAAARGVLPGFGGMAGGQAGAALGAALAPETGGLSLALPIAGAIGGGLLGYVGAEKAERMAADALAPKSIFGSEAEQADVQTNPNATMFGGFLGAGGLPRPGALAQAGESILTQSGRAAITKAANLVRTAGPKAAQLAYPEEFEALNHVLHIAGNAGVGAAQGALEGQTPGDIALSTAGMMMFNKGWIHHPSPDVNVDRFKAAIEPPAPTTLEQTQNAPTAPQEGNTGIPEAVAKASADPTVVEMGDAADHAAENEAPATAAVMEQMSHTVAVQKAVAPIVEGVRSQAEFEQDMRDHLAKEGVNDPKDVTSILDSTLKDPALSEGSGVSQDAQLDIFKQKVKEHLELQKQNENLETKTGGTPVQTTRTEPAGQRSPEGDAVGQPTWRPAPEERPAAPQQPVAEAGPKENVVRSLPRELAGAKPRYKQSELKFESDLDKAAYISAQSSKSFRDADYLRFVKKATGLNEPQIRNHGRKVKEYIKSVHDPKSDEPLVIPDQGLNKPKVEEPVSQQTQVSPEARPPTPEPTKETPKAESTAAESLAKAKELGASKSVIAHLERLAAEEQPTNKDNGQAPKGPEEVLPSTPEKPARRSRGRPKKPVEPTPELEAPKAQEPKSPEPEFTSFLRDQNAKDGVKEGVWKLEDIQAAQKYTETGDAKELDSLSSVKRMRASRLSEDFKAQSPQEREAQALQAKGDSQKVIEAKKEDKRHDTYTTDPRKEGMDKIEDIHVTDDPDQTKFSVNKNGKGMEPEKVEEISAKIQKELPFLKDKIFVHNSPESLDLMGSTDPEIRGSTELAKEFIENGGKVTAFMDKKGNIHLIANKVPSTEQGLRRLIAHEVFHRGEEYIKSYDEKAYIRLQELKNRIREKDIAKLGDGVYKFTKGDWRTNAKSRDDLRSEWITRQIENGALEDMPPDSWGGQVWSLLKSIWAKITGNKNPSFQDIQEMWKAMQSLQSSRPEPVYGEGIKFGKENGTQFSAEDEEKSSYHANAPTLPYFSKADAERNVQELVEQGADPAQIALGKVFGATSDVAHVKQTIAPMERFAQEHLFGKHYPDGDVPVTNKSTAKVREVLQSMESNPDFGSDFSKEFRAQSGTKNKLHSGDVAAGVLQNEIVDYAIKLTAQNPEEGFPMVQKTLRFANEFNVNNQLNASTAGRLLQLRSMASKELGLVSGMQQLEKAKTQGIEKAIGGQNVDKINEAVNNPTPKEVDKAISSTPDVDKAAKDLDKLVTQQAKDYEAEKSRYETEAGKMIDSFAAQFSDTPPEEIPAKESKLKDLAKAYLIHPSDTFEEDAQKLGVDPHSAGTLKAMLDEASRRNEANLQAKLLQKGTEAPKEATAKMIRMIQGNGIKDMVSDILNDPEYQFKDISDLKGKMVSWLKSGGFSEAEAQKYTDKYEPMFRASLSKAKEMAFDRGIQGVARLQEPTIERIRQSIRSGDPDAVANGLAEQAGFTGLNPEDVQKMAQIDLAMRTAGPTEQSLMLRQMASILQKASPEISWSKRIYKSFVNSALSGLSTISLHYTQPAFATATRVGTEMANTLADLARGRITPAEAPARLGSIMKDYVASYRGYVDTLKRSIKNDAFTISYGRTLKDLESLSADMDRQIEKIKTGNFAQKAEGYAKLLFASTDLTHRMLLGGVDASNRTMQQFFTRSGARRMLQEKMSDAEMLKAMTEATKFGNQQGQKAVDAGRKPEEASGIAVDATNQYIRDFVEAHLGEGKGDELGQFATKEAGLELGNRKGEKGAGWDVFNLMAETAKNLANYARRENPLLGRMLTGFVSVPANLANRSLAFTPYGLARAMTKSREISHGDRAHLYTESMGSDMQLGQRYLEGVAGTVGMAAAAALYLGFDKDDPNYTGPRITLNGPTDKGLREAWLKMGNRPGSVEWVQGGKVRAAINFARGGPESLKLPFIGIGALDDMRLNGTLGTDNVVENAGTWLKTAASGGLKQSAFFGLKNISDIPAMADSSGKSVASNLAWTASGLIPWSGFIKSISKIATGPLDQSSVSSALSAQIPFASTFGHQKLNALGDPGSVPDTSSELTKWSDRAQFAGLPFYINMGDSTSNAKAYAFMLDHGVAPQPPGRANLEQKNGMVKDSVWENYVKTRGKALKQAIVSQIPAMSRMKSEDLERHMKGLESAATRDAKAKLGLK